MDQSVPMIRRRQVAAARDLPLDTFDLTPSVPPFLFISALI